MQLVVVCWLLFFSPTLAHASGVHLLTDTVKLDAVWLREPAAVGLSLSAPCLACRLGTYAYAPVEPAVGPPVDATRAVPPRPRVIRAPSSGSRRVIAIGESWRLGHGREFSIRLTPTQEECAPLMRLKF
jgi:hypothetical protein